MHRGQSRLPLRFQHHTPRLPRKLCALESLLVLEKASIWTVSMLNQLLPVDLKHRLKRNLFSIGATIHYHINILKRCANPFRTMCINCRNVAAELLRPIGLTSHSYNPIGVPKAVTSRDLWFIGICQNSKRKSRVEK
ncbi:unnamed protein product [Clavelina lepadiformis]|uniref:Uncharacterized protein n=1 Tax=Clavelina lepadiformis TaxID=159417 RepID=A0ABP0GNJ5_CLALP